MADPRGFIKYQRTPAGNRPVAERIQDYAEVEQTLNTADRINQAARCMDCGVPFCHWACSLGNKIPEFQDHVFRGEWKEAFEVLESTNTFPEITGRICPALCEHSCVLNIDKNPVTIRENEVSIAERAFMEGYVVPKPPKVRTGKKVAVVGSGPAGLTAATLLNRAGHTVTLYEKDENVGGLMRFGIPDFKLNKRVIERRVNIYEKEGLIIKTSTQIGKDVSGKQLVKDNDAVVLTIGAMKPRDLTVEGRDLEGIHFAMDFLSQQNRVVSGKTFTPEQRISAKDKKVLVIGGGDTGSDCVGTSNRHGATKVTQIEILPKPPVDRAENNPWPYYAWVLKTSSSHEEGCERKWSLTTKRFIGKNGKVTGAEVVEVDWVVDEKGNRVMKEVSVPFIIDCDLVLLSLGFVHCIHEGLCDELGLEYDNRGNIKTIADNKQTSVAKVFAAGDSVSGATLVLRAIEDGKVVAQKVTEYLSIEK